MTAARQFILKVHERCNLACDYCYVFNGVDQRWRSRPAAMPKEVAVATVSRIAEHAEEHRLAEVEIVLHGGEPLLAGVAFLDELLRDARARIPVPTKVTVQTNGLRLDEDFLALFREHGVRVGVSVDGAAAAHDRHRKTKHGQGSYDRVSTAVRKLCRPENLPLFAGLLCVVDVRNDPVDTYEALLTFKPPAVDFLLPHGTWTSPPPAREGGAARTPYADWLIAAFNRWYADPTTPVRLFESVVALWLGGHPRVEGLGDGVAAHAVVQTDGSIEHSDVLTIAYKGAGATGLSVLTDRFDTVLPVPSRLPSACGGCAVSSVCGGGQPAHRYEASTGFDNPSVYCPDLFRFTAHVRSRIASDLTQACAG